jgi:hypothetical protein
MCARLYVDMNLLRGSSNSVHIAAVFLTGVPTVQICDCQMIMVVVHSRKPQALALETLLHVLKARRV